MSLKTWLRPLQITFLLMILSSISLAQAQVPSVSTTTEEGEQKPSEVVISEVSPDFASPRDTINTFLLNMEQLAEDKDNRAAIEQVFRTLDVPETLGKQRGAMVVQLLGIFNSLGRINVETMAPGINETKEKKLKRFEFFPDNPYPVASQMIKRTISHVGSEPPAEIVLVVTDSGVNVTFPKTRIS
jgi:hypothetical protein